MENENLVEIVSPPKVTSKEELPITPYYLIGYLSKTIELIKDHTELKKGYIHETAKDAHELYLKYRKQKGWDKDDTDKDNPV